MAAASTQGEDADIGYAKEEFADLIEASPAVGFLSEPISQPSDLRAAGAVTVTVSSLSMT